MLGCSETGPHRSVGKDQHREDAHGISYPEVRYYRLGVKYDSLPVNRPQCSYRTYNKDGAMRFDGNGVAKGLGLNIEIVITKAKQTSAAD